ncbi:hypothetical protein AM1_1686 [Acaryochloris marina MBIC11017]|uniref:Uncharacterized protein n=1 Tax=Acaryochloris marina (strain MBIC 11017) TaxID=329726 RepID=B0CB68_ACAM1|nr:hypothetical protein AM1_1686 [Acaryochloris marina MBIC11017]
MTFLLLSSLTESSQNLAVLNLQSGACWHRVILGSSLIAKDFGTVWGKPQLVHANSIKSDIAMLWLLELLYPHCSG